VTAIAYTRGVMAADTAMWRGKVIVDHQHKIKRTPVGLVAAAGPAWLAVRFHQWVAEGCNGEFDRDGLPADDGFTGLLVKNDGTVLIADTKGPLFQHTQPFVALGGAQDIMIGALAAGASAEAAVRIAITYHDDAGGAVQIMPLADPAVEELLGWPVPVAA
jgi:hypothetical protein